MDEAYRRLGHKLSQRVTSGEEYRASVALNLGSHPFTAFSSNPQQVASNTHANQVRSFYAIYTNGLMSYTDRPHYYFLLVTNPNSNHEPIDIESLTIESICTVVMESITQSGKNEIFRSWLASTSIGRLIVEEINLSCEGNLSSSGILQAHI
jgi:hypothetical protein